MMDALTKMPVDFTKVTMFHLDEYVGLPITHIASFRKYLTERFVNQVPLKEAVFVNGEGDVAANIDYISHRVKEAPIDVGVIGIGENGHIAFNDPPADFDTEAAHKVVTLTSAASSRLAMGWFATVDDAQAGHLHVREADYEQPASSPLQLHAVKAEAIRNQCWHRTSTTWCLPRS